jgi:hypothetical protein
MLEREESVPCMVEKYKSAPTELKMEGFVVIIT